MNHPTDTALAEMHSPAPSVPRLATGPEHSYLKDFVYGAIDGVVTTFAVVSGVAGAGLSSGVIVVLGVANLVGDGFSMAASNFLGTRAEEQHRNRLRRIEDEHIDRIPDGEREEIRQIMAAQGFENDDLDRAVQILLPTADAGSRRCSRKSTAFPLSVPWPGDRRRPPLSPFL